MTTKPSTNGQPKIEVTCSRDFIPFLHERKISVAVSTYQTNRLFLFGRKPDGRLSIFERIFDRAMGLYAQDDRMYLATRFQIWRFDNVLTPGETHDGYDRLFVPRTAYTTGDLDIHDMALDKNGRLLFANTLYSCLAALDEHHSFQPVWQPPFISRLAPEDRCHLNGFAMAGGVPRYATTVSRSDVAAGWRDRRESGGCLIDIQNNEIISEQLSMPHSPRLYRDRLWLANSGNGEFGYFDLQKGCFEPIAFCPGYIRGIAFHDRYALVGLSLPRYNRIFSGLGLDNTLKNKDAEPFCGLMVVDLESGIIAHWLRFEGGLVTELYDLQVLPDVRYPTLLGFRTDEIQRLITFEQDGKIVRHNLQAGSDTLNKASVDGNSDLLTAPVSATDSDTYRFQASTNMIVSELVSKYSHLTFPPLAERARGNRLHEPLVCITAANQAGLTGMALAEIIPDNTAHVVSLFVLPEHRQRQLGRQLLQNLEKVVQAKGAPIIDITYRVDWPGSTAVERLLAGCAWSAPVGHSYLCKTTIDRVTKAPGVHDMEPGTDFELFPWSALSTSERNRLLSQQDKYPAVLSPFQEEERLEPCNSIGLRYKNDVVGWMITHRTRPDTIQYTSLYVAPDVLHLQPGIGQAVLSRSIRLQIAAGVPRLQFMVNMDNAMGVNLLMRRLKPYLESMVETRFSCKPLQATATAA